jgi:hypothetical protein
MRTLLLALLATVASSAVLADDMAQIRQAMNNLQHEMTQCSAFFALSAACIEDMPKPDAKKLAANYNKAGLEILGKAWEIGASLGMTDDAMNSRAMLATDEMKELVSDSCTNIASALVRYGSSCKELYQTPDKALVRLMQQEAM